MTTKDTTDDDNSNSSSSNNNNNKCSHADLYCYCLHPAVCNKCGKPRSDRSSTTQAIQSILNDPRPARSNVFGQGPLLVSDSPKSAQNSSIVLGIDEAGRGAVLGPMVYGLAYWSVDAVDRIPTSFNDSKQLSEDTREKLWKEILQHQDIGFALKALLPNEISRNMLRVMPYNLNEQSHDTAIMLIRKLIPYHTIQTCYIDTVGNAGSYQRKLEREFPNIEFVVESKADAKYAPCSAASVVAKVVRDKMIEGWKFGEPGLQELYKEHDFGSGYPSDPKCKAWMDQALQDPVFGYSDFVRFSWAPCKSRLAPSGEADFQTAAKAIPVIFEADLDDEEMEKRKSQKGMSAFLGAAISGKCADGRKKRKLTSYFNSRKLQVVSPF